MITALNDEFAKRYLATLLATLGEVETSRQVIGEVQRIVIWTVAGSSQGKRMQAFLEEKGKRPDFSEYSGEDRFAREYLSSLLVPYEVEIDPQEDGQVRELDVCFSPRENPLVAPELLGWLGRMASTACAFQVFWHEPDAMEINECLANLFHWFSELENKASDRGNVLEEEDLPILWILIPSASLWMLKGFSAELEENWPEGIYFMAPSIKTAIALVNQLPPNPETLWLRVLGNGRTQAQAVREVAALPEDNPLRHNVLKILADWHISLQNKEDLTDEERELMGNLSPAYLRWQEEG